MADKDESDNKSDFLATARKRFAAAQEDEKSLRDKFVSDLRFASPDGDDQWDPLLKMQREHAGRPAMSFPRCHTFVQQVSNEARQKKPQIKFSPRLDDDKDTAEVLEGMARFIQYDSEAQIAYETAIEYSAGGSFGYYRFLTDYCDDESDDLELKIVRVLDPLCIYGILVPACFNRKPRYGFVVEDIPKDEFKALYPDSDMATLTWSEAEEKADGWVGSESVRTAEYWWCEEKKVKGKRRPECIVHSCKTNGIEILPGDDGETSETVWPGSCIPIVTVLGKQMIMEGKARLFSVVRPQKSAQLLINYSKSRIAETLSTSPISPFMVAEGQINGFEKEWGTLNTVPRPYITYKVIDTNGRPVPPPVRDTFEPPIQALSAFVMQEIDDMKATTGIFDASLGNQANETSGRAIMARKQQSSLSTMHFMDNLARSFKQGGDIIAEIVPKIYDTEREVEILGEDEKQKVVKINAPHRDENGQMKHYKVKDAKMSYVVTMGQAFDSKRMESFDAMQTVLSTAPNLLPILGDILFRNSDLAGAEEAAERMHKMLPPQLQDQKGQPPLPPEVQAQMAQGQQMIQSLNAACQHYEGQIKQLEFEKQAKVVDNQAKAEIRRMEIEADLAKAEITTKAQVSNERLGFVEDMVKQLHMQSHEFAMQTQAHAQQQSMADQQQAQMVNGQDQSQPNPQV